jgi:hypothetical protein
MARFNKKPEKEKRKCRVMLNFNDAEWKLICDRINQLEAKPSEYMRSMIAKGYYRQSKYPKTTTQAISLLSRAGWQLNECCNRSGGLNADLTAETVRDIKDLIAIVRKGITNHDRETDTEPENSV